ncbi:MAG: hypothetical protein OEZ06_28125 [Myxococcales bacterium]|nr:hypothetical protein [Myxococcales bacterium]
MASCGTDCNDADPILTPHGGVVCDGERVISCFAPRGVACDHDMVCIRQIDNSGVCGVKPNGYQPPPAYSKRPRALPRARTSRRSNRTKLPASTRIPSTAPVKTPAPKVPLRR